MDVPVTLAPSISCIPKRKMLLTLLCVPVVRYQRQASFRETLRTVSNYRFRPLREEFFLKKCDVDGMRSF
ncbi:hypothetical protein Y032_0068g190 [Ancylostoma ceylanicum]|uniref:Uncharacterized protein n=1 Tax=Ancylostoma ceylanicum TaxID=53326 RepID=A0A016TYN0_9BILA|nr:hypothetical protein Y032_0068g190 [Ancylostoma ceylanicum]